MKKRVKNIILLVAMVLMVSVEYVYAATYDATWSSNGESSYTRAMGASTSAKFNYSISETYGEYQAQIKDPLRWYYVRKDRYLKKGASGSFTRTEGSKDAYWRGWVKNGYIRVTLV